MNLREHFSCEEGVNLSEYFSWYERGGVNADEIADGVEES